MLAQIIEDPNIDPEKNLKYFRALDFQPDSGKQFILSSLVNGHHPKQSFINAIALLQMDPDRLPQTTASRQLISQSLESVQNRPEFILLVEKYHVKDKGAELMDMVLHSLNDVALSVVPRSSASLRRLVYVGRYRSASATCDVDTTSLCSMSAIVLATRRTR